MIGRSCCEWLILCVRRDNRLPVGRACETEAASQSGELDQKMRGDIMASMILESGGLGHPNEKLLE